MLRGLKVFHTLRPTLSPCSLVPTHFRFVAFGSSRVHQQHRALVGVVSTVTTHNQQSQQRLATQHAYSSIPEPLPISPLAQKAATIYQANKSKQQRKRTSKTQKAATTSTSSMQATTTTTAPLIGALEDNFVLGEIPELFEESNNVDDADADDYQLPVLDQCLRSPPSVLSSARLRYMATSVLPAAGQYSCTNPLDWRT
jgi:hypothetical protein